MKADITVRLHSDEATQDSGKVRLGDMAPAFSSNGASQGGKKVARDAATEDGGKVRLGDMAPLF
ncbi:MAG: hypothetical protein QOJ86_3825 [Bradyrhizobium sp.]|nr:hypothetical protein [Bradyrhizobium sp.]